MTIISSSLHNYTVEAFATLSDAMESITKKDQALYLVDEVMIRLYPDAFSGETIAARMIVIEATEEQKSFDQLTPIFLQLLERGLKRDGVLVVIGGGVMQDIGCFIATVLFRGVRWELIPTTLLAQADSCIGSKSSINIGSYKNQIGTFYPPHRVLLVPSTLKTLPWDEIRSGLGEVIKLQLLTGADGFDELMQDLAKLQPNQPLKLEVLSTWVERSMAVKKPYIEVDEYDLGIRNILNYGHTFGHAYESATHYAIPHGIAVVLGMLTATYLSSRLGLVSQEYYEELKKKLEPWYCPYDSNLRSVDRNAIFAAIKHDKKNTGDAVNCILTKGPGCMEKLKVDFQKNLIPTVNEFLDQELSK